MSSPEKGAACDPPCSLACVVTAGSHHTTESLRAAALTELEAALFDCPRCGGEFKTPTEEQYHLCVLPPEGSAR